MMMTTASFNAIAQTVTPSQDSSQLPANVAKSSENASPATAQPTPPSPGSTLIVPSEATPPTQPNSTDMNELHDGMKALNPSPTVPAPAPVVIEIPKADPSLFEHIVEAANSKNIDALLDYYSKDSFVVVTEKGEILTDREALRGFYTHTFVGDKKLTLSLNIDKLADIAPGVAVATGKIIMKKEDENQPMESIMTATIRYEDGAWKIVSKHSTLVETVQKPHEHSSEGGFFKTIATLIIGIVVGYFGFKYTAGRKGAQH
jgi:ketosteroid isomerase-like protein